MTQEILKLALEYIEAVPDDRYNAEHIDRDALITAIEEALAQPKQWGASAVTHPEYVAEQKRKTEELRSMLTQPEQKPVAWADIQKEAQQIVESKFLWKKFIDGTPLSNDIACWMADFVKQHTTPPQRTERPVDYERGFIDGMQKQMQSSVDKAVNAMSHCTWVGLTDDEMEATFIECGGKWNGDFWKIEDADFHPFLRTIEAKLKEVNT